MGKIILTVILLALITACGTIGLEPSNQLVQQALTLKFSQTQQQIQPFKPPKFGINRLVIIEKQPLIIQALPAYRIKGTYDFTIELQKRRVTHQQNPFEVYLQRQKEGKTWRLAVPQSTGKNTAPTWRTYLI